MKDGAPLRNTDALDKTAGDEERARFALKKMSDGRGGGGERGGGWLVDASGWNAKKSRERMVVDARTREEY